MKPMLRFGSSGPDVEMLQKALNEAGNSIFALLATDGQFGPKTHGRVMEFQQKKGLMPDGIAGPNTHGALEDAYKALAKMVDDYIIPPEKEEIARQRIVTIAQSQFSSFGWQQGATPPIPFSPRIAIRYMTDPVTRSRQGGSQLSIIFALVGKPAQKCLTIPTGMEASEMSEADYSKNRNKRDLENWCGYFALSVWKSAGIKMPSWDARPFLPENGKVKAVPAKDVKPGDIGLVEPMGGGRNHHFIVTRVDGNMIHSIDGNAGQYHSIFARHYLIANPKSASIGPHMVRAVPGAFGQERAYFVTPNWSKVL